MPLTTAIAVNFVLVAAAVAALALVCRVPFRLRGGTASARVIALPVRTAPERARAA